MSLIATAIGGAERLPIPDALTRAGISFLVGRTRQALGDVDPALERRFAADMDAHPIAVHTSEANAQHYEVPAAFFAHVLGPRRKYSCCLYGDGAETLAQAEERALAETMAHAGLADGQRILELGCGWGSLSLAMAERFPNARITAVSNSRSQRAYIEGEALRRGFGNLTVVTADMNAFATTQTFDRVVSVEMFEHMSNWQALLGRVRSWLAPDGRLFLHVFSHRSAPYRFDHRDKTDWIAQHFFTGGIMPSHGLIRAFESFDVEAEWRWSGTHYARTAEDWLKNFDQNRAAIDPILRDVYGADAGLWARRWRLFFLATAGLFGHADGTEWGVSHYRLKPAS
ncbi:SAM-dependent methyltransferase [Rhodoplanes elegans]|uniref:SAM-dependent methyltransferase n=1 Tax=Rhodoplanes elegans TaxID=29408 RepID=A0A327KFU4_9BRAD|nr:cyclopropane-fatty-acyl-phospholipid synthase family protein [Rhodoplanes elegans]MBK5956872.1 SAM-dependent methyltransferase [Rhodoplanes elegans]RAI36503.1 SAM-dependent methyltransferase [Rhodoplanes elegans]